MRALERRLRVKESDRRGELKRLEWILRNESVADVMM